jgi:predicted metalloendopeptidase
MAEYTGSTDPITMLHMTIQRMEEKAEKTNEALFAKLDKTNDKVDKLSEIVSQQALLFERLTTIETNHKDSIKRMYREHEKNQADNERRFKAIEEHAKVLEDYMTHDGCPAHKSFLASRDLQDKRWHETVDSISNRVSDIDKRLKEVEDAPVKIVKTISNRVLMVFGTALGSAILYLIFGVRQ